MFMRTSLELAHMTDVQLIAHHAMCCRMAATVLARLTPEEQTYVSQVEAEMTRRKKNVAFNTTLDYYKQ